MGLYTKNGHPLQVFDNKVYSKTGKIVGRLVDDKVYGTNRRYVGTIVNDRLVYRSTQSAVVSSSFSAGNRSGTALANRAASGIWGDEPKNSFLNSFIFALISVVLLKIG